MKRFSCGKPIEVFNYDFDGKHCRIVKYHPWKRDFSGQIIREPDLNHNAIMYHCDAISTSCSTIFSLLIHWLAEIQLGANNGALANGIIRALEIEK